MTDPNRKARIKEQIDENLRRVYRETLEEEIPDRFRELLQRLRAQEHADRRDV